MKTTSTIIDLFLSTAHPLLCSTLFLFPLGAFAESTPAIVDDFSHAEHMTNAMPRMLITDKDAGGQSHATQTFSDGIASVQGKLAPGRGAPGFVSIPLILAPDGSPTDASNYTGVRLRVKVKKGSLMVQIATSEIVNFDYHTSAPITRDPNEFKEVRISFASMNRAWSPPQKLNLKTVTSINLVSAGMAPDTIDYEIDEIAFY
jgi:hypothetical protein